MRRSRSASHPCSSVSSAEPAVFLQGLGQTRSNVLGDGVREQKRLLRHEADGAAQRRQRDLAHVDAVDEDRPGRRLMQSRQQGDQRGLARSGGPDECDGLSGLDANRHVFEHRPVRSRIGERQVARFDRAGERRRSPCRRHVGIADVGGRIHDFQHPLPRRHAALQHVRDPAERDHRPAQHHEIRVERHELAERDAAADHLAAAHPQHEQRAETEEKRHARIEHALQPDQDAVAAHVFVIRRAEPPDLVRFLVIRADDADTGERLLDDRAQIGELRLDGLEAPVNRAAEILHAHRHERQRKQRDERQPRVDRRHQDDRDGKHEDRAGRIHHRRADHHAHGVQIVGRARHQVAGAPGLVVAERHLLQPREKCVPMSYSISRDAPMMMRRIRNRNSARTHETPSSSVAYVTSFCRVTARAEIVNRELEDPRGQQLERGRQDDADEAEAELTAVTKDVWKKTTKRGAHLFEYIGAAERGRLNRGAGNRDSEW